MEDKNLLKLAKILRTDKDVISEMFKKMSVATKKNNILKKIIEENNSKIEQKLKELGLKRNSLAQDVYDSLIEKIKEDDKRLFNFLKCPILSIYKGCRSLFDFIETIISSNKIGFFIKKEKLKEFLYLSPPPNIMKALNYKNVDELLKEKDILEIYAALRFVEDKEWLNNIFFKQYKQLKLEDFEEREIELRIMTNQWLNLADKFLEKKYHNVSHLKEVGVIFILPQYSEADGETMRLFSLIIHYFFEIQFYSKLFKKFNKDEKFSQKFISALRGDIIDKRFEEDNFVYWLIVQRYLAKEDEYDWRLFVPHINPEAIHWTKAETLIAAIKELNLDFWQDLSFVGNFFKSKTGDDILISFNLVDNVMSLVKQKEMIKYLYHHQEALWNKIFSEFVGKEMMEKLIVENFDKGYIKI